MSDPRIAELLSAGRHEEAAQLLRKAGAFREAADVLAKVWRYTDAVELALASDRPDDAYQHALASGDARLVHRVIDALAARPEAARRAADTAELRGRIADAAALRRAGGQLEDAAVLYERAGELAAAARIHEAKGDLRRAGMLYEKRVAEAPEDGESALALGRILLGIGRAEHAARALQLAIADERVRSRARAWLVRAFVQMDLLEAAADVLDALRAERPELPLDPREAARLLAEVEAEPRAGLEALVAGRYRVLRTLGAGASGRVLAAEDVLTGREVAIKVLAASGGTQGRDALARFAREAEVARGIEHPNVVRVYDFLPSGPLLVMELMTGGTLADRLVDDAPLEPTFASHVLRAVARALEAVHRRGVVHRDLKPANVFFGPGGEVKVGDFGVAHLVDAQATRTGAMLGTLAYMAPEQITGEQKPDASTDLYALGVMAFRMFVGVVPFPGPDFVAQHLGAPVPRASERAPWLGPAFDRFFDALLAKHPEDRPRSAAEALAALEILPIAEAQRAFERRGTPTVAKTSAGTGVSPGDEPPRMQVLGEARLGARRASLRRDTLLGRDVLVLTDASAEERAHYRRLAQVVSPFVQAVLAIDDEAREVVLEWPRGERETVPVDPVRRADLVEALAELHRCGAAHGAIGREAAIVGAARAVLLLPPFNPDAPVATSDDDRRALEALFEPR